VFLVLFVFFALVLFLLTFGSASGQGRWLFAGKRRLHAHVLGLLELLGRKRNCWSSGARRSRTCHGSAVSFVLFCFVFFCFFFKKKNPKIKVSEEAKCQRFFLRRWCCQSGANFRSLQHGELEELMLPFVLKKKLFQGFGFVGDCFFFFFFSFCDVAFVI
jgi:hypothetical protein